MLIRFCQQWDKLEFAEVIRRERIYPFRNAGEHPRLVEQEMVRQHRMAYPTFSIQYTPNKNVSAAERMNPFPTHTLEHIPFNEPCKFQLIFLQRKAGERFFCMIFHSIEIVKGLCFLWV